MNKAIFIDKDGTLIEDVPYKVDVEKIALMPYAGRLKALQDKGYLLIVVSNQTGVAKGLFQEEDLVKVKDRLVLLLKKDDVTLDGFYYCPHDMQGKVKEYAIRCEDHKPRPGMLLKAAQDYDVDLSTSWMIGDKPEDVEAGKNAGCKIILITNGQSDPKEPDFVVHDLGDAVQHILEKTVI